MIGTSTKTQKNGFGQSWTTPYSKWRQIELFVLHFKFGRDKTTDTQTKQGGVCRVAPATKNVKIKYNSDKHFIIQIAMRFDNKAWNIFYLSLAKKCLKWLGITNLDIHLEHFIQFTIILSVTALKKAQMIYK